jgi:hypothetical protein
MEKFLSDGAIRTFSIKITYEGKRSRDFLIISVVDVVLMWPKWPVYGHFWILM